MRSRPARKILMTLLIGSLMVIFIKNNLFVSNNGSSEIGQYLMSFDGQSSNASLPSSSAEAEAIEAEMAQRRSQMRLACREHGLDATGNDSLHRPYPWEFFVSKEHHLVWCNVFKSGSSSWMYIFNRLAGHTDAALTKKYRRTPPVTLARNYYSRPTTEELLEAMKTSISFIVGRNPFERLVSGYRDKIFLALRGSYHEKVGRQIILKYRGVDVKKLGRLGLKMKPTFTEFVRYVVDDFKAGVGLDMHWTPVYSFCNPCQVNLTHIIKFESFERDQLHIIRKSGIEKLVTTHRENVARDGRKTVDVMQELLDELPLDLYYDLLKIYLIDFHLFGYDVPSPRTRSGLN